MIELTGVSKRYGDTQALAPSELHFQRGKTSVLMGSSGSGKSTVLRLVLGLIGGVIFGAFVVSWMLGNPIRTRPIFFIGLILIILAIQFISLGLLGELVVKGQSDRTYRFRNQG